MLRDSADIGVKQPHMKAASLSPCELAGEVVGRLALAVANAVYHGHLLALQFDRDRLDRARAEDGHRRRPLVDGRPPAERIVVPVDDERADASLIEAPQTTDETNLCSNAALGAVVDVAGQQDEQDVLVERQLNQPIPSLQRSLA